MKISDERLERLKHEHLQHTAEWMAFCELQRSRALVAELRALAERMAAYDATTEPHYMSPYEAGQEHATDTWLRELDSLLASHTEAKP